MRKLVVAEFLTLDGVMQAPGAADEDTEDGFKYGGWQVPFFEDAGEVIDKAFKKTGALLLGRKTYDIFAAYWPKVGKDVRPLDQEDVPFADFMNNIPKYVASRTKDKLEWQNSNLLEGDAAEAVAKLKQENGKDIYVIGSGNFAQTLMQKGLVDEYFLMVHPLVLGSGKRLFREGSPQQNLKLLGASTTTNGVLVLTYRAKGS
jgi:dihydrofolate reductase